MLNLNFLSDIIQYGIIVSLVSFFCVLILTPRLIKVLTVKGEVVQDYHKAERPNVPRPAGPAMAAGIGMAEIIGVIALLPAVMNSFLFLSSVKRIVEHRQVKSRPTVLTEDFKLAASSESSAPITLLRLILTGGPLSETKIVDQIFVLAAFSAVLSFVSILIQYYFQELH